MACSGNSGSPGQNDGSGPRLDSGSAYYDAFAPKACDPACTAPKICSVIGTCIDPGTCAHNRDCKSAELCDKDQKKCVPIRDCGAKEIKAGAVPPNLLINLDRSCSMDKPTGTGLPTKWEIAVQAISRLLADNKDTIRFGLTLFPDREGDRCTQDAIPVPVGPAKEAEINTLLTAALTKPDPNFPDGPCVTNIDTAMAQAAGEPAFKDASRKSFVLLITDGKQSGTCGGNTADPITTQTIENLHKNNGVDTFVVGFGGGVDANQLNIFADAGGQPNSDPQARFYKAEDQVTLDAALAAIASKALGCVYQLEDAPDDLSQIYVFFDDKEVLQDTTRTDGWHWNKTRNRVTFHGPACEKLKSGEVKDLDIVYGCNIPVD